MIEGAFSLFDAHFFFVDIVGLSDPDMSTKLQKRKLNFLYRSIAESSVFKSVPLTAKLILPTGDGVAIGFLQRPELPLQLAIELHKKIQEYNEGQTPSESIYVKTPLESLYVRIGIHNGPVFVVKDPVGNNNIWGPGIIDARRIMDLGEEDHILVSSHVAKTLSKLSDEYKKCLHELGEYTFKHNVKMVVYSAYSSSGLIFGNPDWPIKMDRVRPKYLYPYLEVNITILDPVTMLVHYERIYEIQNVTDKPVRTIEHQIATDVPKTWEELNIKIIDDKQNDLLISDLEVDRPKQKSFATTFSTPLGLGDKRRYVVEYDVEEPYRYFQNLFLTKCEEFVVRIDYPANPGIKTPVVYEMNLEEDVKEECLVQPKILSKDNSRFVAEWTAKDCRMQQCFRFEW